MPYEIMVINRIVTQLARRAFARVMRFREGTRPTIPPGDALPRLLYLHIPFCERLCPYCSFHRIAFRDSMGGRYYAALRREMTLYKERGYDFHGLYAGGGTPTVMIDELEETLHHARRCFSIGEISVETNPNHLTERNLDILKRAGVNRLSVGIQSFDDGLLKAMDRYDKYGSGAEVAERLKVTMGHFGTLNADMIFNFPLQDRAMLDRDLEVLQDLRIDQITYYPLMVSQSTKRTMETTMGRVDHGREEVLYRQIVHRLEATYSFSSAWCFSRKGRKDSILDEYIVDYDEYAGLGSGSIGYLKGTCYANTFDIGSYIDRIKAGELPLWASRDFTLSDKMHYDFLMKLFATALDTRTMESKYEGRFLRRLRPLIITLTLAGALTSKSPYLRLTQRGHYLWVVMMREFFTAVNNFRDFCRNGVGP